MQQNSRVGSFQSAGEQKGKNEQMNEVGEVLREDKM
jgi:hypothetical protein